MSRIIAVGDIDKEDVRYLRSVSEKLKLKSPTVKVLVGNPRKLRRYIPNPDKTIPEIEKIFFGRQQAKGTYLTESGRRKNAAPLIALPEYDSSAAVHELCHLKEEELRWDSDINIATILSQISITKRKSRGVLSDINYCMEEFFEKHVASRYGFAQGEFDILRGQLEKSLNGIINGKKRGRKYLERPSAGTSFAMYLALETSWKPFGRFIRIDDLQYLHSQATTLISYYREEVHDILPICWTIADRIKIPPSYMNLFHVYNTFINLYESVVDAQSRMSATERKT